MYNILTNGCLLLNILLTGVFAIVKIGPDSMMKNPQFTKLEIDGKEVQKFVEYQKLHTKWTESFSKVYPFGWPEFDCPVEKDVADAPDIHHLRPENVKVIGAIGDSLSAGRAARAQTVGEIDNEYRGVNFVTGADQGLEHAGSLRNIFAQYNPDIIGGSTAYGTFNEEGAGFNLAISGSFARDMLPQAIALVERIKMHPVVDFENDWKFVNIFIGSNDLCRICTNFTELGVDAYQKHLISTVSYLRDNLPRTYVNIVPSIYVKFLQETHAFSEFYVDFHKVSCPCIFSLDDIDFKKIKQSFDNSLSIFYGDAYQSDTFAVSIAPATEIYQLPRFKSSPNLAILALDCFHFSELMHDTVSKHVWRNIFEPIVDRSILDVDDYILDAYDCPKKDCPYLRTVRNSLGCGQSENPFGDFRSKFFGKKKVKKPMPNVDAVVHELDNKEEGQSFLAMISVGAILVVLAICLIATIIRYNRKRWSRTPNEQSPLLRVPLYDEESIF